MICGFTEDNVIFSSRDGGASWTETDFNKEYEGFYPTVTFEFVSAGKASFAALGFDKNGKAHLFISTEGKVWSERELSWLENGSPNLLSSEPVGLQYDSERDQYMLSCSDSTTLILPPCSHCNQLLPTSTAELLIGQSDKN